MNINFHSKIVLLRVDFNVPQDDHSIILDDTRIKSTLPTIHKILKENGKLILISHLGRPQGQVSNKYSLRNILPCIENILGKPIIFLENILDYEAKQAVRSLKNGEILLFENIRFYKEEEEGNEVFAWKLAQLGDVYVNDAFGSAHRAHASTTVIAKFFSKDQKCFGYLMKKELQALDQIMKHGKSPISAIIGGSKVSSKIDIMNNILSIVDHLVIAGGMAYTFIKAQHGEIGNSIFEKEKQATALLLLEKAYKNHVQIHLPIDVIAANSFDNTADTQEISIKQIPKGWMGLDIGPQSINIFSQVINTSRTILWNGPVGVFEIPIFSKGTIAIGQAITEATQNGAFSLVGGGDSVSAIKQFNYDDKVSYVSTGGGAMLESLEGKILPGVSAMLNIEN